MLLTYKYKYSMRLIMIYANLIHQILIAKFHPSFGLHKTKMAQCYNHLFLEYFEFCSSVIAAKLGVVNLMLYYPVHLKM